MEIKIKNLNHSYDSKLILNDINIDLKDKNAVALIGPSGAGKSTLLRLLSKIEDQDSGQILIDKEDISLKDSEEYYKEVGFVFQAHTLFPHLNVLKNITLILEKVHKVSKEESKKIAFNLLKKFDLHEHASKLPNQLSGGQSQRVSIVRSLSINPRLLFLDEPTSALDPVLTQEVLNTILKLKDEHMKFIIVTHEILFAKKAADYIIFMDQGKIVEHGDVSILDNPQTNELKQFLSNVFVW